MGVIAVCSGHPFDNHDLVSDSLVGIHVERRSADDNDSGKALL